MENVLWDLSSTTVSLFQFEKSSRISKEADDQLNVIPKFCFPDCQDWKPSAHMPRSVFTLHPCFINQSYDKGIMVT